jgi:hypothetical protein
MRGPQFTLRQTAVAIAVIGVLLAILVRDPMALVFLATASIPVAVGFTFARMVRRGVEKFSGYSMKSPRILLILILAAIGLAALAFTILNSDVLEFNFYWLRLALILSLPTLLGFVIYQVSQGSLRFRLTVEIVTLFALLALTGWTWRPPHLLRAAEHADALAAEVSAWAESTNSAKKRDSLRRESEWFRRRASSLRRQAFWYGLTHGSHGDPGYHHVYDTEDLVREIGILEAMDAHEMRARQEKEGVFPATGTTE